MSKIFWFTLAAIGFLVLLFASVLQFFVMLCRISWCEFNGLDYELSDPWPFLWVEWCQKRAGVIHDH